jgi:ribosomal protein S18
MQLVNAYINEIYKLDEFVKNKHKEDVANNLQFDAEYNSKNISKKRVQKEAGIVKKIDFANSSSIENYINDEYRIDDDNDCILCSMVEQRYKFKLNILKSNTLPRYGSSSSSKIVTFVFDEQKEKYYMLYRLDNAGRYQIINVSQIEPNKSASSMPFEVELNVILKRKDYTDEDYAKMNCDEKQRAFTSNAKNILNITETIPNKKVPFLSEVEKQIANKTITK